MECASAESKSWIKGEPPITFDDISEPPDYVNIEDSSSPELDDEIESHVEAVEQRDADSFSARVERSHRGPRRQRRDNRRAQRRPSGRQRPRRKDDDDEQQDEQPRGRIGSLRAGLAVTVYLIALSAILVVVLFATDFGAPTAPPDIEITPRKPTTDVYLTIQPPPPATPLPAVKQTPLRLPNRRIN
jgi:hypothetical protein